MTAQPCDPDYTPDEDDTTASRKHFLDRDPHDPRSCRVCGDVYGWGFLHLSEPVDITDDPLPRLCSCGHYTHRNECWGGVPSYPNPKPCECKERAT